MEMVEFNDSAIYLVNGQISIFPIILIKLYYAFQLAHSLVFKTETFKYFELMCKKFEKLIRLCEENQLCFIWLFNVILILLQSEVQTVDGFAQILILFKYKVCSFLRSS